MNKIGIFGGTFNPVHNEHVNIVKAAQSALSLDKVIVLPSDITPNKGGRIVAESDDRFNMCRLAFENVSGTEVSDYELAKGGISYTYLTCRALKEKFQNAKLYFIMGADMLANFSEWKYPEEILKCVTLAVCAREDRDKLKFIESSFRQRFHTDLEIIEYVGGDVGSTKIRTLAALGENIADYLDKKVANYISEHSLYALPELWKVKKYLKPERWQHTLRVAVMAAENCHRLNIPEETAITAAALHDCAKYLSSDSEELKGFVCPQGVPEPVVHQYSGAYVAQHTFGVENDEILNAIRYHTSGRENMSPLEKLLFLCDMLEEGRNYNGVKKLREIFSHSIDDCLFAALEHQLNYLESTGEPVYPLTRRAFEYLKVNKYDK